MKILRYANRKCDPVYWTLASPEQEARAFHALFVVLESWQVYNDLDEPETLEIPAELVGSKDPDRIAKREQIEKNYASELKRWELQHGLRELARAGDAKAARKLMTLRKDCEYEEWTIEDAEEL